MRLETKYAPEDKVWHLSGGNILSSKIRALLVTRRCWPSTKPAVSYRLYGYTSSDYTGHEEGELYESLDKAVEVLKQKNSKR